MFICRYCDEEFSSQKELKKHERECDCNPANLNNEIFRCRNCHQVFYSKDELKRHKCQRNNYDEYDEED